jgi:hypothetical protein
MADNETANDGNIDYVTSLAHMISIAVESSIRGGKMSPDEAIRAIASSLWATVVAYSAPEHFETNSAFAVATFETCKDAATEALKELEFDDQHEGTQWGNS